MPSRQTPQYQVGGAVLGVTPRSLSLPTAHHKTNLSRRVQQQQLPVGPTAMGTLAAPIRYPREQLRCLPEIVHHHRHHPLTEAGKTQLPKHRPKSAASYCDDGDWRRSASPAPSTHSGHSSPSEVGDSGVCSEHDTPPPVSRHPSRPLLRHHASSDSDSESNVSSDSMQECFRGPTKYQWSSKSSFSSSSSSRRSSRSSLQGNKATLPDCLLTEIREKWQELQERRRHHQQIRVETPERGGHHRAGGYHHQWSAGRTQRHSCPASPSLSRSSSTFPSSLSLFEEEVDASRSSPVYLEGWRPSGTQMGGGNCDDTRSLYECRDEEAGQGFAGIRDIFAPQQQSTIKSYKGTVRGVKNRVRAGIATFTSDQRITKHFMERERGKVVVYVTTLGIVRDTYERCLRIRKILWTLLVRFEERDVFMARDTQLQLLDRLRCKNITVPHVFLEGQYLGDAGQIERMNECGELRRLLQPYRKAATTNTLCDTCGGYRLLPCSVCNGSKKSVHRNDFTLEFVALKCSSCDESGLVKCMDCAEYKDDLNTQEL